MRGRLRRADRRRRAARLTSGSGPRSGSPSASIAYPRTSRGHRLASVSGSSKPSNATARPPTVTTTPVCSGSGRVERARIIASRSEARCSYASRIAPVGELLPSIACLRATSAQTLARSERSSPIDRRRAETEAVLIGAERGARELRRRLEPSPRAVGPAAVLDARDRDLCVGLGGHEHGRRSGRGPASRPSRCSPSTEQHRQLTPRCLTPSAAPGRRRSHRSRASRRRSPQPRGGTPARASPTEDRHERERARRALARRPERVRATPATDLADTSSAPPRFTPTR